MKRRNTARLSRKSPAQRPAGSPGSRFRIRASCPPALYDPKAFSHVVEVEGGRLIFVSGQVPVDAQRRLTTREFRSQVEKVFDNLQAALESVGASFSSIVKTTNYLTDVGQAAIFREVREARFAQLKTRPASTTVVVKGLVDSEYLIEIEVIAAAAAG
jgi:2-iminobutanoate/2-iminopropanoate deaminase